MLDLLPRDQWQYSILDCLHALKAACGSRSQRELVSLLKLGEGIPIVSGRAALLIALKALNLPSGAKVGVPLYCCPVVFRVITRAGYVPVFLDVDEATFCISTKDLSQKYSELHAVIAVHMFGNMCDIPSLQGAAPNVPFVEDCALSLGSMIGGKNAGSFGSISIFSFRSGKYVSVGEGGAVFSTDANLKSKVEKLVAGLPKPTFFQELRHIGTTYVKSLLRSKPLYGLIGHRLWERVNKKLNLSARSDVRLAQIYKADLALARLRFQKLPSTIDAYRANAQTYTTNLSLDVGALCHEPSGSFYNRLNYPIIFPSPASRDAVAAYLLDKGVDTIKYLDDIVETAKTLYGYHGTCPNSERLSKTVLLLPNHEKLRADEVRYILKQLNTAWAESSISALKLDSENSSSGTDAHHSQRNKMSHAAVPAESGADAKVVPQTR